MKIIRSFLLILFFVAPAIGQERPAQPATQIEVNAGTLHNKYVAPDALKAFNSATNQTAWVSTSGSDATGNGTSNAPFASLSAAIAKLSGNGRIVIRGGDYDGTQLGGLNLAGKTLSFLGYPGERAKFWFSAAVPASAFTALSNGIYTATPSQTFTNYLMALTNIDIVTGFHPIGALLWQTNAPYGSNTADPLNYFPPTYLSYFGETNRCEFTPLGMGAGVTPIVNSNAWWVYTNGLLYVKFAVSNVPGTVIVSSSNQLHSLCLTGDAYSDLTFENLEIYGAYSAFKFSGVARWQVRHCLIGFSTFETDYAGNAQVENSEYVGCDNGVSFYSDSTYAWPPMPFLEMSGCWIHDYTGDNGGVRIAEELRAVIENSTCYGATNGEWGWISDGGHVDLWHCVGVLDRTDGTSPFQIGDASPSGHNSYMGLHSCYAETAGGDCLRLNDQNDNVECWNTVFNIGGPSGVAVNVIVNPTTHSVKLHDCRQENVANANPLISNGDTTRYTVDGTVFGTNVMVLGYLQANGGNDAALVSQNHVRGNTGYGLFYNAASVRTIIDQKGFYYMMTNSGASLPATAPYPGMSLLWNSNGFNTYGVKAQQNGTAWASTNLLF